MGMNLKEYLTEEQRKRIFAKTYKVGDVIYREGDSPRGVYFLKSGILALTYISENGTESLLRIFTNCCFFGHRTFLTQGTYHATATVLKEAEILFLDEALAQEVIIENHSLLLKIARNLAIDLKNAENRLRDMVGKKASQRVIETLIYLKHQTPDFPWTRREIGEFCGVKTETVSRALSELESKNLITREGRSISIIDEQKLIEYLEQGE